MDPSDLDKVNFGSMDTSAYTSAASDIVQSGAKNNRYILISLLGIAIVIIVFFILWYIKKQKQLAESKKAEEHRRMQSGAK